jgi:RimJ/RimL family protein N-acetyltransferase
MINGQSVVLTELDPNHADVVRGWLNDPEIRRWMISGHIPITHAAELAWYEQAEAESAAGTGYNFEIHAADDMRLLGICGLMDVARFDRHGEVGIFIGDSVEHGKGFGRDALLALVRFGFETLGLNTLRLNAIDGNDRAIGLYKAVGFKPVGTHRESRYIRGRFHDVELLDMTRDEFDANASS